MREYVKGVYRISEELCDTWGDDGLDIVVYDGELWWLHGWEIGLKLGDVNNSFEINEEDIKELLYEWKPRANGNIK